jgi:hypothetical protein
MLDHTRDTLRDISVIAQRDIERNLELYALSLQAVVDGLQDLDVMALPSHLRREIRARQRQRIAGNVARVDQPGEQVFRIANACL